METDAESGDAAAIGGESFHHSPESMNIIKLSGVIAALSSVCVITSSTVANAQDARRIVIPKTCASDFINRGARSNDPSKAVQKALEAWNRLSRQRGYFTFKGARNPKVTVIPYPSGAQGEVIWKANVIAYPCKFMNLRRR